MNNRVCHAVSGRAAARDVTGKRVALIGTGASAAQVGPAIAGDVAHLTVFQRSRHWCPPYQRVPVPDGVRWVSAPDEYWFSRTLRDGHAQAA